MYCPSCGKEIKDTTNFCPYCRFNLKAPVHIYENKKNSLAGLEKRNLAAIILFVIIALLLFISIIKDSFLLFNSIFSLIRFGRGSDFFVHLFSSIFINISNVFSNIAFGVFLIIAAIPSGQKRNKQMTVILLISYIFTLIIFLISVFSELYFSNYKAVFIAIFFLIIGRYDFILIYGLIKNKSTEKIAGILGIASVFIILIYNSSQYFALGYGLYNIFLSFISPSLWFYIFLLIFPILSKPLFEKKNAHSPLA